MLTSLTLKNWRTHAETTLEFGKGTNVIVGVMGSGKSSIVNAISYSLFGTFPAIKARQVSLDEIIMNKPNQADRAETALEFTQDEKKYRVERIIKRDGTNEAKLLEGNRLIAGPKQKDVNEKVENLLGLNYELFSRAVYAEQNEMDFFLKLSPSERKKKFDELLELEKYEIARKNSTTLQNELLKENMQRKSFVAQQKETLKSHEEEQLQKLIIEEETAIQTLTTEIENIKKALVITEKEYFTLSEKEKQNKMLEELSIKVNSRIEGLKEDILRSERISVSEVAAQTATRKKEITEMKEKVVVKEKEWKEIDLVLKKTSEELKVLEYENRKLSEEERGISSLKGKCPTCKQELNEEHKTTLTKELNEKSTKVLEQIREIQKHKKDLEEKYKSMDLEKETLKRTIDEKNKDLYKLEALEKQATEADQKRKQLESLVEELPKVKKQLSELGFDKKKLDSIREEVYKDKSLISVSESKIKSKLELKKSYENTLEKIAIIKRSIDDLEKEMLKNEEAAKNMGIFSNCLIATQVELRESLLETINSAMSSIWGAIYPYKDFTDAKLCVVSDGYDLQVKTINNGWVRVEGVLSGGERSAAALCIRIAFALVLTKKLSMLILDEPTHNLDSNAVAKLSEMLREEMPKLVEQIFVITHDKQLENAASSNLYLLTRNKDVDESTKCKSIMAY